MWCAKCLRREPVVAEIRKDSIMASNRALSPLQLVRQTTYACTLVCSPLLAFAQGDPANTLPTLDELDNRIQVVQTTAALSDDEKGALIQYFERTIASLSRQSEYQERARIFSEVQITAPEQIAALDAELSVFSVPPLPDPTRMSPTELQSILAARRLSQREWRNQAANLEAEIRDELGADISGLIAETRARYDELSLETISNALSESFQGAAVEARAADEAMLRSRIDMLDQRLLSRRPRLDILRRQLELLQLNIAAAEDQIERLSSSEFAQYIEDADRRVVQAQGFAESAEPVGGELFARAVRNVELAEELRQLIGRRAALAERGSLINKQVDRLSDQLSGLTEQLDRPRLPRSPKFGAALLRQKKLINSEPLTAEEEGDFDRALSELRLREFELFEASQEPWLGESELSGDNALEPQQQLSNIVRNQRRDLIGQLTEEYTQYDEQLSLIDDQVQRLNEMGRAYQERVDRHLLWNPSADVIGMATVSSMMDLYADNAETGGATNSTPSVAQLFVRQPLLSVLAALLVAALLISKKLACCGTPRDACLDWVCSIRPSGTDISGPMAHCAIGAADPVGGRDARPVVIDCCRCKASIATGISALSRWFALDSSFSVNPCVATGSPNCIFDGNWPSWTWFVENCDCSCRQFLLLR